MKNFLGILLIVNITTGDITFNLGYSAENPMFDIYKFWVHFSDIFTINPKDVLASSTSYVDNKVMVNYHFKDVLHNFKYDKICETVSINNTQRGIYYSNPFYTLLTVKYIKYTLGISLVCLCYLLYNVLLNMVDYISKIYISLKSFILNVKSNSSNNTGSANNTGSYNTSNSSDGTNNTNSSSNSGNLLGDAYNNSQGRDDGDDNNNWNNWDARGDTQLDGTAVLRSRIYPNHVVVYGIRTILYELHRYRMGENIDLVEVLRPLFVLRYSVYVNYNPMWVYYYNCLSISVDISARVEAYRRQNSFGVQELEVELSTMSSTDALMRYVDGLMLNLSGILEFMDNNYMRYQY